MSNIHLRLHRTYVNHVINRIVCTGNPKSSRCDRSISSERGRPRIRSRGPFSNRNSPGLISLQNVRYTSDIEAFGDGECDWTISDGDRVRKSCGASQQAEKNSKPSQYHDSRVKLPSRIAVAGISQENFISCMNSNR